MWSHRFDWWSHSTKKRHESTVGCWTPSKSVGLYIWFRYEFWESSDNHADEWGCVTQWERPDFCTCFLILGRQRPPTSVVGSMMLHDPPSRGGVRASTMIDQNGKENKMEKKRLVLVGRHGTNMFEWFPPFTPSCVIHSLCNCQGILTRIMSCSECRSGFRKRFPRSSCCCVDWMPNRSLHWWWFQSLVNFIPTWEDSYSILESLLRYPSKWFRGCFSRPSKFPV